MKKSLGALLLALSALVATAACASQGASPGSRSPNDVVGHDDSTDDGALPVNLSKAGLAEIASRPDQSSAFQNGDRETR